MKNLTHKIRLVPTKGQEQKLLQTVGTARYAYNWALASWRDAYDAYKLDKANNPKPSAYTLSKQWTKEKPVWAAETNRGSQTKAILNVGQAYINFWNGRAKAPVFHKRGGTESFYVANDKGAIKGKAVNIPCVGWVKLRENLRFDGKIMSYTVSKKAGQWHVSVSVELPNTVNNNESKVGVDVGINKIAVASDESVCENPKYLKAKQDKIKRLNRKLARQKKGSNRRNVTKDKLAKAYLDVSNKRNDAIHKFTSNLAKNHGIAVIEDLSIEGMKGERYMNRLLQDTAMATVHTQLGYKMETIKAPRYFPSSKTCSSCNHVKTTLPCNVRIYKCKSCSVELDRDLNAAINLKNTPWVTG